MGILQCLILEKCKKICFVFLNMSNIYDNLNIISLFIFLGRI